MTDIQLIPLNKLYIAENNVRKPAPIMTSATWSLPSKRTDCCNPLSCSRAGADVSRLSRAVAAIAP